MRPFDPRLLSHARAARRYVVLSVAVGVAAAVLLVVQASLLAGAISSVFVGGAGLGALTGTFAALATVSVARAGLAWLQEVAADRSAQTVKGELRRELFIHIGRLGPGWLSEGRSGELTTLATRGIDALDAYLARYLPQVVLAGVVPAVVLFWVLPQDLIAGVTILLTLPLIPLFMALVGIGVRPRIERQTAHTNALVHHVLDVVAGLTTLKLFGRSRAQATAIANATATQRRTTMATLRLAFLSSLVLEFLATISVALVAVGIGLRLVDGALGLDTALLILILAPEAYVPLRQLGTHYHASAEGLTAVARVIEVLEVAPPSRGNVVDIPQATLRWEDVTVTFPDRAMPALKSFDLTVSAGEIVALTGPSGSGKSTALAVALGFIQPQGGCVVLADDGRRVTAVDAAPAAWLGLISWVPQRPYLFAGTVAENVLAGRPGASTADLHDALRAALADEFVAALPQREHTVVGEGGRGLSAGQRQRLALARALLRDGPVLLLDEPTANLDETTEAALVASLRKAAAGRITVIVAHRPALLEFADRVVRLEAAQAAPP